MEKATWDVQLAEMFHSGMRNTLETTLTREPDGTTFLITGGIPAMWLRDSSAQMLPLRRFLGQAGGADARELYEVDGLGNTLLMDDANRPSLLSLPLTGGLAADDPLYLATRGFVLSTENPFFLRLRRRPALAARTRHRAPFGPSRSQSRG